VAGGVEVAEQPMSIVRIRPSRERQWSLPGMRPEDQPPDPRRPAVAIPRCRSTRPNARPAVRPVGRHRARRARSCARKRATGGAPAASATGGGPGGGLWWRFRLRDPLATRAQAPRRARGAVLPVRRTSGHVLHRSAVHRCAGPRVRRTSVCAEHPRCEVIMCGGRPEPRMVADSPAAQ
jgi:hypothetical protein